MCRSESLVSASRRGEQWLGRLPSDSNQRMTTMSTIRNGRLFCTRVALAFAAVLMIAGAGVGLQSRPASAEEYYFSTGGCINAWAGSYFDGFQVVSSTVKPSISAETLSSSSICESDGTVMLYTSSLLLALSFSCSISRVLNQTCT